MFKVCKDGEIDIDYKRKKMYYFCLASRLGRLNVVIPVKY
jgi:hypothetical protein